MRKSPNVDALRQRIESLREDIETPGEPTFPAYLRQRFESRVDWLNHAARLIAMANEMIETTAADFERLEAKIAAWRAEREVAGDATGGEPAEG